MGLVGFEIRPLSGIEFTFPHLIRQRRNIKLLQFVVERFADFAELGPQGLQIFVEHRTDRVGDDVFNDVIRRVVRAGSLAFGFVVGEVDVALADHDVRFLPASAAGLRQGDVFLRALARLRRQVFFGDLQFEFESPAPCVGRSPRRLGSSGDRPDVWRNPGCLVGSHRASRLPLRRLTEMLLAGKTATSSEMLRWDRCRPKPSAPRQGVVAKFRKEGSDRIYRTQSGNVLFVQIQIAAVCHPASSSAELLESGRD